MRVLSSLVLISVFICGLSRIEAVRAEGVTRLFREEFLDMKRWEPLTFPKIDTHTKYRTEVMESGETVLLAESEDSASAMVYRDRFNVYDYPIVRWRWRVENILKAGDARRRSGDDYPIRVYVLFDYDPGRVSFLEQIKFRTAKLLYGEYPPMAALNYIWANRVHDAEILTSTYTDRSRLLPLDAGSEAIGQWKTHEIDIVRDYTRAFGVKPPPMAGIAIMGDSDNTGERSRAMVDFLEVRARGSQSALEKNDEEEYEEEGEFSSSGSGG